MPKIRLNKANCDSVEIPDKGYTLYQDTVIQGLALRVLYTGAKTWVVQYKTDTGSKRRVTLGRYPIITAKKVEKKALAILASAADGGDPQRDKQDKRQEMTFTEWCVVYEVEIKARKKSWRDDVKLYLPLARKLFGQMRLSEINRVLLVRHHLEISEPDEDGMPVKPTKANRWLASVSAAMTVAVQSEYISFNPAFGIKRLKEGVGRTRVLNDDEWDALVASLAHETLNNQLAFRILMATGARSSEVTAMQWGHLRLDEKLWRLPDTKSGKPQFIALRDDIAALLRMVRATRVPDPDATDWVILGPGSSRRGTLRSTWLRLKEAAVLPPDVRLHDIRRTVGLRVARKHGLHVASKLLRHSDIRITEQIYAPLNIKDLRGAVEDIRDVGAGQLGGDSK